jgi:uncharacterized coiled-coil protein SlyX
MSWRRAARFAAVLTIAIMVAASSHLQAATSDQTIRTLRQQLHSRDAVIRDLARRVEELEKKIGQAEAKPQAGASVDVTPPPRPRPEPRTATPAEAVPGSHPEPSAPGQVTATQEEAERALERTLVATGVLLLPFGQTEIEPGFSYIRREDSRPTLATVGGNQVLAQERVRRNEYRPSLELRFGLPLDAQLETEMPFNIVEEQRSTNLGAAGRSATSGTGAGNGDFSVGLAKTVLREKKWRPDLVARFTWDTPTGQTQDNDVALGGGFSSIVGELVALKKQDPLAFFIDAAYRKTFEHKGIEPGDVVGFELGAFLATSPDTSLQLSLAQDFVNDTRRAGRVIKDSDQVLGVLNLGASSILGHNVLLDIVGGIGLTDEAPDYSLTVSLPIRFGVARP